MTKGAETRAAKRAAKSGVPAPARAQPPAARPPKESSGGVPPTAGGSSTGLGLAGAVGSAVPERVIARIRRHARLLVFPALLLIAVAGGMTYALGVIDESWRLAAIVGGALLIVLGCLLPFLAWLTRRATITTRRVVLRHGVFSRTRQELLNSRGTDVEVRANWVQSMFGSGDVRINTGHDRVLVIKDAPKAELVQAALQELMDPASPAAQEHRRAMQQAPEGDTVSWGGR